MENSMSTLSAGLLLFLIMDPLGNIPLFLSLLKNFQVVELVRSGKVLMTRGLATT